MTYGQIIKADALEYLSTLKWASVDCIVTDPPYWSLDKWRNVGTTTRLGGGRNGESDPDKFFATIDREYLWNLLNEFGRVLKPDSHVWLMADGEIMPIVLMFVREALMGDNGPFTYAKPYPVVKMTNDGTGIKQGMGYHGRASHEYVCLLEKGRRRFTDENWPDVFQIPWDGAKQTAQFTPDGKPYPTAKPVPLYRRLVELSTREGDIVLDPFAGSGTLLAAARQSERGYVCVDASERSIQTMQIREAEYDLSLPL
jgi:site-specific DNA-methyltransferase (adenine-specific)